MGTLAAVLAARLRLLPAGHPDLCQSLTDVGVALAQTGDRPGAVAHLREAFAAVRSAKGLADPATANAALTLSEVRRGGRQPEELDEADRALAEVLGAVGGTGTHTADLFDARGRIAEAPGQEAAPREFARRAADVRTGRASAERP